jgi:iron-sulfur cluster assembly accessory protein
MKRHEKFSSLTMLRPIISLQLQRMTEPAQVVPVVTLTESAAEQVKSLLSAPENQGKILRVYVERGGCSGLQYGLVFDEQRPDDVRAEFHGVSVLVDPFSASYLAGSKVDYVDSLTGGGFKVSNPRARQSCGCGKSFET